MRALARSGSAALAARNDERGCGAEPHSKTMAASNRKGALTAGIILIFIGLLFLVENFMGAMAAWRLVGRYWPLILIYIGLRKLYRHATWQEAPPPPLPVAIDPPLAAGPEVKE